MNRNISRIGLGTFPLAGVFGADDENQYNKVIRTFFANEGFYVDTAPLYGFGNVERLLGDQLKKYPRESIFLISKCGYVDVDEKNFNSVSKGATYSQIINECDLSLERLRVDYLDLYMLHSPKQKEGPEEIMKALVHLHKVGKVKFIGLSNVDLNELKEFGKYGNIDFVQNRFNLITRSVNDEMEDYLLSNKIGFIPYHVLEIGMLTDKAYKGFGEIKKTDFRNNFPYWKPDRVTEVIEWVKKYLAPISRDLAITIEQLVIAWTLNQTFIPWIIIGYTNEEHLISNLAASKLILSSETIDKIENAYDLLEAEVSDKYGQTLREFRGLNEKYY